MKQFVSQVVGSVVTITGLSFTVGLAHASGPNFNTLSTTSLSAPLPLVPRGTSYFPLNSLSPLQSTTYIWGDTLTLSMNVVPSIPFGLDDNKGIDPSEMCGNQFPKHLGTDYAAPAGTPVYAIADGTVVRANGFTNYGDYYVVVESGSGTQKWTTLYGHLNSSGALSVGTPVTKGVRIGTLFNYHFGTPVDIPHLHLGIRKGAYMNVVYTNPNSSTRGFACATDPNYQTNKYNFVSPEQFNYLTKYWGSYQHGYIPIHITNIPLVQCERRELLSSQLFWSAFWRIFFFVLGHTSFMRYVKIILHICYQFVNLKLISTPLYLYSIYAKN